MTENWFPVIEQKSEHLFDLWLKSLREIRHDTMNDIQILSGYLTMNKPQEGRRYIEKLAQRMQQESILVHLDYSPLSVYLITFNYMCDNLYLEVELNEPFSVRQLKVAPEKFTQWIVRCLNIYQEHILKETTPGESGSKSYPENQLYMSWDRLEGELKVTLEFVGCLDGPSLLEKMRRFAEELKNEQVRFVEGLHHYEPVFTFYVPFA